MTPPRFIPGSLIHVNFPIFLWCTDDRSLGDEARMVNDEAIRLVAQRPVYEGGEVDSYFVLTRAGCGWFFLNPESSNVRLRVIG